jgi:hypothetical protein
MIDGLARPAKGRGPVVCGSGSTMGGERGVGRIRSRARIQKEIIFEFQLILEFGRTLENCTRRFRRNFDMEIFPKIL